MTKPVTAFTTFGSNTSGTTTQLDNNFLTLKNAVNDFNTYGNYLVDSGTANAYVVTLGANLTGTLTAGLPIQFNALNTNTGASTLAFNGAAAKNILNADGSALSSGQIQSGGIISVMYDGTQFRLLTSLPASGWVLLSSKQANANTSIDFNNVITGTYDQYRLTVSGLVPSGNDAFASVRVGTGNVPTYQATGYQWGGRTQGTTSGLDSGSSANSLTTSVPLNPPTSASLGGLGNTANATLSGEVKIMMCNGNAPTTIATQTAFMTSSFIGVNFGAGGAWNNSNAVTSVQVLPSNGNILRGNFSLYGLVK